MPKGSPYPPEFRAAAVRLHRSSERTLRATADEIGVCHETLRIRVRQAEIDEEKARHPVARLMRELGLVGVSKREGRRRTAKLSPEAAAAPDLVHRRFRADSPNELWVADITCIETWEGYLFLACVMDMCAKRIVGCARSHASGLGDHAVDGLTG